MESVICQNKNPSGLAAWAGYNLDKTGNNKYRL
jgi:hypothetical protein